MSVKLICVVCGAECDGTIRNADDKLVCQPRELYYRVGQDRYVQAMKDHRLLVPYSANDERPRKPQ